MTASAPAITVAASQDSAEPRAIVKRGRLRVEILVVASVAFGAVGQLVLKASLLLLSAHGTGVGLATDPRLKCAAGVFLGLSIYAVGTLFWVKAVSRACISYLYPLSAGSYALVAVGGHLLFGEVIHPWRWAGIAVITLGVALMAACGEGGAA
jgi:drug/metabolite transporter (DMT)-like permease